MNRVEQPRQQRRPTALYALLLFVLLLAPGLSREARAQWTAPDAQGNINNTNPGHVGVGTTAPQSSLHVSTSSAAPGARGIIDEQTSNDASGALLIVRKSRAGAAVQNGDFLGNLYSQGFDGANWVNSSRLRFAVDGPVAAGSVPTAMQFLTGDTAPVERMRITSAGNVGIGTASPAGKLGLLTSDAVNLLDASVVVDSYTNNATSTGFAGRRARGNLASPAAVQSGDILSNIDGYGYGSTGFSSGARGKFTFRAAETWSDTAQGTYATIETTSLGSTSRLERLRVDPAGNVGIGTSTPTQKLHVAGNVNGTGLCIAGDCKTAWSQVSTQWATSGSNISYSAGRVGIGTASPEQGLHVNAGSEILSTGDGAGFKFRNRGSTSPNDDWVWYSSGNIAHFWRGNRGNLMSVTTDGNVGIGTDAPTERLHVVGNINVTGNINAKYQDVAEWVPSTQSLAAGTVVVLDTARSNHVVASSESYDTRVAGVVSAQPGVLLGERGDGKLMVATTGRVKVRVDATRGPIRVGDLLVTSDVEGLAMKSEPAALGGRRMHLPGTLIGKALEPLEKGVGEILVLLSLQ